MGNGIVRRRENKFTQVSNSVLRDGTLSFKAKGLYAVINSYLTIPNFTLYKSFLMAHCMEGEKAFESGWKELKESGYLIQHKLKDEYGKIYYEYELLDEKEENNHTPKKEGVENAGVEKAPHGKSSPGKRGVYNNTDLSKILDNNTEEIKNNTHMENIKDVCATPVNRYTSLNEMRLEAEKIIGEKLWKKEFESAMKNVTVEKFEEHLSNWHIHKLNAIKPGAYFIRVLSNDIEPTIPQKKPSYNTNSSKVPQRDNFDQREYSDEELDKYYANLRE